MVNCKAYKQYKKQDYQYLENIQDFKIIKDLMIVMPVVEGVSLPFVFDTGASVTVITDTTIIKDFHKRELSSFGKATFADGQMKKNVALTIDNFDTEIFKIKSKMVILIPVEKPICDTLRYRGIIGSDVFWNLERSQKVVIDFDKSSIEVKNEDQINKKLSIEDYELVNAEFKNYNIFLNLNINGQSYKALFDTGFSGFFVLPNGPFDAKKSFTILGNYFSTANSDISGRTDFYEKIPFEMGNMSCFGNVIVANASIPSNIVGLKFIKNFNWIIDYQNEKIYAKRNSNTVSTYFDEIKNNYIKLEDNSIKISAIKEGSSQYTLNSEIIKVQNSPVTNMNICDMKKLLTSISDWEKLQVIVK